MPIRHAFTSAKSDSADPTEIQPSHWNDAHTGSGAWSTELTKSVDQSVTSSTTLVDDTELSLIVTAGSIWRLELVILYNGTSATGDYQWAFAVTAGTLNGWVKVAAADGASDSLQFYGIRVPPSGSPLSSSAATTFGTDASSTKRFALIEAMFTFSAAATLKFKFAQNFASGTSRTLAGSTLRAIRIL